MSRKNRIHFRTKSKQRRDFFLVGADYLVADLVQFIRREVVLKGIQLTTVDQLEIRHIVTATTRPRYDVIDRHRCGIEIVAREGTSCLLAKVESTDLLRIQAGIVRLDEPVDRAIPLRVELVLAVLTPTAVSQTPIVLAAVATLFSRDGVEVDHVRDASSNLESSTIW